MKLLVATDGSAQAEEALAYATDISDATGGAITVAYCVNPDVYEVGGTDSISDLADAEDQLIVETVEDAEARGLDILDDAASFASELGHDDVETVLLYGDPVTEVTDYAEDDAFDTIVVGHRGRSERTDLMVGSVAKAIVERSTIPVTVVR